MYFRYSINQWIIVENNERFLTSKAPYIFSVITSSLDEGHALLTFNNLCFPFSWNAIFTERGSFKRGRAKNGVTWRHLTTSKAESTDLDRSMKIQKRGVVSLGSGHTDDDFTANIRAVICWNCRNIVGRCRWVDQLSRKFAGNTITLHFSVHPSLSLACFTLSLNTSTND